MFQNLKAEMSRKGVKVIDIANLLGVTEKTASNYISRRTKIAWMDVLKIQRELFPEYDISYLFEMKQSA